MGHAVDMATPRSWNLSIRSKYSCVTVFSAETHPGEYPAVVEISPLISYDGEVSPLLLLINTERARTLPRSTHIYWC